MYVIEIDIILKIHNFPLSTIFYTFCIHFVYIIIIILVYEIPISEVHVLLVTGLSLKATLLYSGTQEREHLLYK